VGIAVGRIFIVANENEPMRKLRTDLTQKGLDCLLVSSRNGAVERVAEQFPGLLLLEADESIVGSEVWEQVQRIGQEKSIPIIALIPRETLNGLHLGTAIDDFVVKPYDATEVALRIKRIIRQKDSVESEDVIRCGDLVIDSAKCEVLLSGEPIILTYKEYQLLKFLAMNKGKVFTREALLAKVWGWDYYGGDRTVDVHVRRLRSKIEGSTHTFIETVRNIGYKFKDL
jgi:DNA-binding response OmpR family regulator